MKPRLLRFIHICEYFIILINFQITNEHPVTSYQVHAKRQGMFINKGRRP